MPELPEGEREGLSPGLSRPEVAEDAVAGGERLLDLAGFDVFLCNAAMRSERLAPALGTGCALSPDLFDMKQGSNIGMRISPDQCRANAEDLHDWKLTIVINAELGRLWAEIVSS